MDSNPRALFERTARERVQTALEKWGLEHVSRVTPTLTLALTLTTYRGERLCGPLAEPVDGAAVDQRREQAQAAAEGLAYGREAYNHMQARARAGGEGGEQVADGGRRAAAGLLQVRAHLLVDALELLVGEQLRHLCSWGLGVRARARVWVWVRAIPRATRLRGRNAVRLGSWLALTLALPKVRVMITVGQG